MNPSERVPVGTTTVEVSRLGVGCAPIANLYQAGDDATAADVIRAAHGAGLRLFDTAPLYGHGLSELRLGRAIAPLPRDEVVIATKVGRLLVDGADPDTIFADAPALHPVFDFSADGVHRSLEASLSRLGVDRVDIVHVHDPDDHAEDALTGAFPALRRWRDEGVVGAIGAGMNQAPMLARFVREAGVDCVMIAGRHTLLDSTALDDLLPACEAADVSVFAAGVFNSGVLADPRPGAPFFYAPAPDDVVGRARQIAAVCERHGVPLTAAAIQLPAMHPAVASVVVGVRSTTELQTAVDGAALDIADDCWRELAHEGLIDPRAIQSR